MSLPAEKIDPKKIQSQINEIARILNSSFKEDVLFYFQVHPVKGFDFPFEKKFKTQSQLKIPKKDYVEFRFLCGLKKEILTKERDEFYSHFKPEKSYRHFFLIPYYEKEIKVQEKNSEYFGNFYFKFEFNLKLYSNKMKLTLIANKKTLFIEKIEQKIKAVLKKGWIPRTRQWARRGMTWEDPGARRRMKNQIDKIISAKEEIQLKKTIKKIKNHMNQGDCYLANLTHTKTLSQNKFISCESFLNAWFEIQSRYGVFFNFNRSSQGEDKNKKIGLACFSPERFLYKNKNKLISEPIKGTLAYLGKNPTKKDAQTLWKNKKEIYEHTLVVDLIRNDLNYFCQPGSVGVYKPYWISIAGKLLQMQSYICGTINSKILLKDCFDSMLPAGSITGTPKKKVCEFIRHYETNSRGYYTGVCGLVEPNGNFDSCVLIRSLYQGQRGVYVGVGSGLTTLSQENLEIDEFKVKLKSFLQYFSL